ncbi:alpha/beta fold hydrolase [Microbacteriaceae bacterium 4G12]
MCIKERFFFLEQESCVIHLPEEPNGFGVLLLGDYNYFVENGTSLWLQHEGKEKLLNDLRACGYTIFSSNLYGRHWGSAKAILLTKRLYHVVQKEEILNEKIHIIAEGMGALIALAMMEEMPDLIRSVVMLTPCLDLPFHLELEKGHKFFYKRLLRELQAAYEVKQDHITDAIAHQTFYRCYSRVPIKIFVPTYEKVERKLMYREYEKKRRKEGGPYSLSFYLPDIKYEIAPSISRFFQQFETNL